MNKEDTLSIANGLGIGRLRRHIFLCTKDKCSGSAEKSMQVWNHLKARLKELGEQEPGLFRTQAHCLRICQDGPIAVVYPEGVWYKQVDVPTCEKIIQRHLLRGEIVAEAVLAVDPLAGPEDPVCAS